MMLTDFEWVKRLHLWHIRHAVGEFAHARQNTSAISLVLSVLLAHTKFNREPIYGSEAFKFDFTGTERCKTDLL